MLRVDERLLHGQILIKWLEAKKSNHIIIIDDDVSDNPILRNILELSIPQNIVVEIYNLEKGAEILKNNKELNNHPILLVKNLQTAKYLHEKGVKINEIVVGRMPSGIGKRKIYSNIFVSDADIETINYFKGEKIPIIIQIVPDSDPVSIYDLI